MVFLPPVIVYFGNFFVLADGSVLEISITQTTLLDISESSGCISCVAKFNGL